jgi:SAM-dependent methyltransferase
VQKQWHFDNEFTQRYTNVRQSFMGEFLTILQKKVTLESAIDVGCGIGHFSKFLLELGLDVVAIDGREENVAEGQRRYPDITFIARNVEDPTLPQIGSFDLVLCAGLLYHLENPFRAVRNLYSLTGKILLIETMCIPGAESSLQLLDEYSGEDQGLNYVAFYPTEACVVKMLYRAGFPFVYRFQHLPQDEQFTTTMWRKKQRAMLVASRMELMASNLVLASEPVQTMFGSHNPWTTPLSRFRERGVAKISSMRGFMRRLLRPWRSKASSSSGTEV